jgi:hypothetical protein
LVTHGDYSTIANCRTKKKIPYCFEGVCGIFFSRYLKICVYLYCDFSRTPGWEMLKRMKTQESSTSNQSLCVLNCDRLASRQPITGTHPDVPVGAVHPQAHLDASTTSLQNIKDKHFDQPPPPPPQSARHPAATSTCCCCWTAMFGNESFSKRMWMQGDFCVVIQWIVWLKCWLCGPGKGAFYDYAYMIFIISSYVYNTALYVYINVCTYIQRTGSRWLLVYIIAHSN